VAVAVNVGVSLTVAVAVCVPQPRAILNASVMAGKEYSPSTNALFTKSQALLDSQVFPVTSTQSPE